MVTASTFSSLGVVLPAMVRDLGLERVRGGLDIPSWRAACGSSSLVPAWLIRRFGVRVTLAAGTLVMVAGFASPAPWRPIWPSPGGRRPVRRGFQMMALIPGTHVLAAVFTRRGLPFGLYFAVGSLGGVAGPWMVWLANSVLHNQWRLFWMVQVAAALIAGAACVAVVGGPAWLARMRCALIDSWPPTMRVRRKTRASRTPGLDDPPGGAHAAILGAAGRLFRPPAGGRTVASLSVAASDPARRHGDRRRRHAQPGSPDADRRARRRRRPGRAPRPRFLLVFALACLAVGSAALSVAHDYPIMLIYAVGSGLGFGLTALSVTMLLLNYFGREHNLEIFSLTCLIGAVSALGPGRGRRHPRPTGASTRRSSCSRA